MLSKNEIANLALGRLGVSLTISDIETETSTQARIIRRHYRTSLDALLEKHDWNFASKSEALSLVEEYDDLSEGRGWKYLYSLPNDCLVLRQIAQDGIFPREMLFEDEKEKWQEVYSTSGVRIYADIEDAYGRYTVKLLDSIVVPPHFGRALAAQLSMDIAPSLITNNFQKIKDALNKDAKNDISLEIANDIGRQPLPQDSLSPFHRARLR